MASARVRIVTFGCKVNQCDSDEIARALAARGYEIGERGEPAETYIINTCTVTAVADAKARKLIRRIARAQPQATVIVTGCLAQRDPYALLDLPGVAAVVPNTRKLRLPDFLPGLVAPLFPTTYLPSRTRAFLKIQDGCDHCCAYCVVPDARGQPVSKPMQDVIADAASLANSGVQELVLCGIRLGAYRGDHEDHTLAALLRQLRATHIPRLRLSSIEPMDLEPDLLSEAVDHPTLCHHLHLPLQAGDDDVLRAMGRRYTTAEFAALVQCVRDIWPDAAITTDVMVGFPGETDEQFQRSLAFVHELAFSRVHVFPYSLRPGTPAAQYPDHVPAAAKRERAQQMLALAEELANAAAERWVGRQVAVLFEERGRKGLTGHTEHYLRLHADGPDEWVGRILAVTAHRAEAAELYAR
jgi:threonylcarbamoyladenosine tRNA methylthiotransferase MtaB